MRVKEIKIGHAVSAMGINRVKEFKVSVQKILFWERFYLMHSKFNVYPTPKPSIRYS